MEQKIIKVKNDDFKYNIDDMLAVQPPTIGISSPARPDVLYKEHLRVVFRFWDGGDYVYIVEAEDGIGLFIMEKDARLEMSPFKPQSEQQSEQPKSYTEDRMKDLETEWMEALDKRDKYIVDLQRENIEKTRRLKEIDDIGEVNTRTAIACLNSVEAMLRHSMSGATHRMRNFYTEAMLQYMEKVRADIRMPKSNDEIPF